VANKDFERIWQALVKSYPTWAKEIGAADLAQTFLVYERLLADIPAPTLEAAVIQHVASSKWFPTIAELRQCAMELVAPQRMTAMEAWGVVLDAMKTGGARILPGGNGYYPPEWADPIIAKVVVSMGWIELCQSDNQEADRAHFMRAYDAIAQRENADAMLLPPVRQLVQKLAVNKPRQLEGNRARE